MLHFLTSLFNCKMKSEAISHLELILPAAVVEACYKLKKCAGSKFRALDKTAGTSSDIVLFKQSDDSVCISISVTRICANGGSPEDSSEINHIKYGSSARRGGRQGRGALKNGCTKNGPRGMCTPVPAVPIERGRTARRARGKWRSGHLVRKSGDDVKGKPLISKNEITSLRSAEVSDCIKDSQDGETYGDSIERSVEEINENEPKSTANKRTNILKTKNVSVKKDSAKKKTTKDSDRARTIKLTKSISGKTDSPKDKKLVKKFSNRLRASTVHNAKKLEKSSTSPMPKKALQRKPAIKSNLRSFTRSKGAINKSMKTEEKAAKKPTNEKPESLNEVPGIDSPKKAKKSSDKLANIWGNTGKRKRRVSKKPKPNKEEESQEKDSEPTCSKPESTSASFQDSVTHNILIETVQNPTETVPNLVKHNAPETEPGKFNDSSMSQITTHDEVVHDEQPDIRQGNDLQPLYNMQFERNAEHEFYSSASTDRNMPGSYYPPNHQANHDSYENNSYFHDMNECFPPAQQSGFTRNTYEQMTLETRFESNMQPGYGISASGNKESAGEELQHITLTNVSGHLPEDSRPNQPMEDHLKLPQKKRPMARQMIDMDNAMPEWDPGHRESHSDMAGCNDSAAQAELEMSVHTLQSVMATEERSNSSLGDFSDSLEKTQEGANAAETNSKKGGQKKNYKREYLIQCKICQVKVKNHAYLFRHVGKLHSNVPDHRVYMEEIRPLMRTACEICGITVSSISNMASHMRQKHSDSIEMVRCPTCDKVYKTANSLRQHMRICHSEECKRYVCHICEAKFAERRGLDEHINCSHITTEVFKCEVCGKSFLAKGRLRRHILIHGEFRHKCNYCDKGFHLKDNMNKHIEIVHEKNKGQRFECEYCSKKFSVKGNMMQHVMAVHLKKYQYSCSVCNTGFRRKGDLLKHVKQKHNTDVSQGSESSDLVNLSESDDHSSSYDMPMAAEITDPSSPIMLAPNPPDEIMHTQVLTPAML